MPRIYENDGSKNVACQETRLESTYAREYSFPGKIFNCRWLKIRCGRFIIPKRLFENYTHHIRFV